MPTTHCVTRLGATLALLCSATATLGAPSPPAPQQAALQAFFAATGGMDWTASDGWSDDPISCDAVGLTCDADGNVLEIFLVDNGLHGELPANLSDIRSLRGLILNRNRLSGPIPPSWSGFDNLQLLSLRDNAVDGTLDDTLAKNATLKVLDLCHNHLDGNLPAAYLDLPELGTLALCNNTLSGTLPEVGRSPNLFDLDLSANAFSGTIDDGYFSLPALWQLNLADNALRGRLPTALGQPAPLVLIDIADNRLTGRLGTALSQFPDLTRVNLARNTLVGPLPDGFHDLPQLQQLDLSGNRLTGSIPTSLATHTGLQSADDAADDTVSLDWNPLDPDGASARWLASVGTDVSTLVSPVTGFSATGSGDGVQLAWTPHPYPDSTEGHYRIETDTGDVLAQTPDLSTGQLQLDDASELDPTTLRVVTVVAAHAANPNTVESTASRAAGTDPITWVPASVSHPVNHGAFSQADWAPPSDEMTSAITAVDQPELFTEQPRLSADGALHFEPSGRVGETGATVTVTLNGQTRTLPFRIAIGEAANRAPTFEPGDAVTTDALGTMQVVEWASLIADGDDGTQAMQFVLDNPTPEWFALQPDVSVPSGTLRFRFNPGQIGSVTIAVTLTDNGGTAGGGKDRSPTHRLTLTATRDGQNVDSAGLAGDGTGSGGGATSVLLWLGLLVRRRLARRLDQ